MNPRSVRDNGAYCVLACILFAVSPGDAGHRAPWDRPLRGRFSAIVTLAPSFPQTGSLVRHGARLHESQGHPNQRRSER